MSTLCFLQWNYKWMVPTKYDGDVELQPNKIQSVNVSAIWNQFLVKDVNRLEKQHCRGTWIIKEKYNCHVSFTEILVKLNWETLHDCHRNIGLELLFKIKKAVVKGVESRVFLEKYASKPCCGASTSSYKHNSTNTELTNNAFYRRTAQGWSSLPLDIRQKTSVEAFKSVLPEVC